MQIRIVESMMDPTAATLDVVHPSGTPWIQLVKAGQTFRIVDLEGNQAVDTLFYNAADLRERYSLLHTMHAQDNLYLGVGTEIRSSEDRVMATITADTCGRHDTVGGGCCSSESNSVRHGLDKRFMHSCRDNFMLAIGQSSAGLEKRDIVSNINFFMNVPMTAGGSLTYEDGISSPGKYVEMRAEMDVLVVISNCPQLNNPCNAYNPTPVRYLVWDAPAEQVAFQ